MLKDCCSLQRTNRSNKRCQAWSEAGPSHEKAAVSANCMSNLLPRLSQSRWTWRWIITYEEGLAQHLDIPHAAFSVPPIGGGGDLHPWFLVEGKLEASLEASWVVMGQSPENRCATWAWPSLWSWVAWLAHWRAQTLSFDAHGGLQNWAAGSGNEYPPTRRGERKTPWEGQGGRVQLWTPPWPPPQKKNKSSQKCGRKTIS